MASRQASISHVYNFKYSMCTYYQKYLAQVMELEKHGPNFWVSVRTERLHFHFNFSHAARARIEADFNEVLRGVEAVREVQRVLGELFPERGIVRQDQHEESRGALRQIN